MEGYFYGRTGGIVRYTCELPVNAGNIFHHYLFFLDYFPSDGRDIVRYIAVHLVLEIPHQFRPALVVPLLWSGNFLTCKSGEHIGVEWVRIGLELVVIGDVRAFGGKAVKAGAYTGDSQLRHHLGVVFDGKGAQGVAVNGHPAKLPGRRNL